MAYQDWVSLVNDSFHALGAGTALSTATTATLSPTTGGGLDVAQINQAFAPNGWEQGTMLLALAQGFITTTATSTTFTPFLAARVGNTGATYVTLATSGAITTGTTVLTGLQWTFWGLIRCTNIATSGNTMGTQGCFEVPNNATAPSLSAVTNGVCLRAPMPTASGEAVAAVDTTQLQGISLRGTLAGANATVQLTQWAVLQLN